ncbi:class II aldolase/adducin family protein [Kosmotoga sp. DU53]|uniref:class II aldolase/adducin family protein n=1 Tax=Kosmotoga sp. DU53 TaxID=1310160 RepID=UPI0007C5CBAD|nr:class II aldolase/adducin family protein [Kosmotoga sp. DU53]OAA25561.1 aldolase [Kosmotoga sp. DU53]
MHYGEHAKEILKACKMMVARNFTVGTWGNISKRIDRNTLIITPSGMNYAILKAEDMVVMDLDGKIIQGNRRPSIEYNLHAYIYKARDDINAVIHTHPIFSTAFAIAKMDIPPVSEELVQIVGEGIKCAKYALPGTTELAKNAVESLEDKNAVLLVNHGTICVGKSLDHAFKICEVVEKAAQTIIYAKILGTPNVISHEDCVIMREFVATKYGQK